MQQVEAPLLFTSPQFLTSFLVTHLDPGVTPPAINTGGSSLSQTFTLAAPAVGAYYYGICVTHSDDSNNSNNCSSAVEVQVVNTAASAISAGGDHTCAILSSTGVARCWGRNDFGRLGNGITSESNLPVDVTELTSGVTAISAGQ